MPIHEGYCGLTKLDRCLKALHGEAVVREKHFNRLVEVLSHKWSRTVKVLGLYSVLPHVAHNGLYSLVIRGQSRA